MLFLRGADAGGGDNAGAESSNADTGTGTQTGDTQTFKNDTEAMGYYKGQFETLTGKHEELNTKYGDLTKKLGKQSGQINELRQIQELTKNNPKGLMEMIAKNAGIKFNFDEGVTDIKDLFSEDLSSEEKQVKFKEFLKARDSQSAQNLISQIDEKVRPFLEAQMKTKYPDWDANADQRYELLSNIKSGSVSLEEVAHLVHQARSIPDAIKAAEKTAYDKAVADISKKLKETYGDFGSFDGGPNKKKMDEEKAQLENVLSIMTRRTQPTIKAR